MLSIARQLVIIPPKKSLTELLFIFPTTKRSWLVHEKRRAVVSSQQGESISKTTFFGEYGTCLKLCDTPGV